MKPNYSERSKSNIKKKQLLYRDKEPKIQNATELYKNDCRTFPNICQKSIGFEMCFYSFLLEKVGGQIYIQPLLFFILKL